MGRMAVEGLVLPIIHGEVFWLLVAVLWVIPAWFVARSAHSRGYSLRLWFVLALFLPWPLVLVVVVSFLRPRVR